MEFFILDHGVHGFLEIIDGMDGLMLMFALFLLGLGALGVGYFLTMMIFFWREKPGVPPMKNPNVDWQDEARYKPPGSWTVFTLRLVAGTALLISVIWALAICVPAGEPSPAAEMTPAPTATPKVTQTPVPAGETVVVTSRGYQWYPGEITVRAGENLVFRFINEDQDVPHNLAFYKDSRFLEKLAPTSRGVVCNGVCENEVRFQAPAQHGRYYFICDVHPFMEGSLFVVAK